MPTAKTNPSHPAGHKKTQSQRRAAVRPPRKAKQTAAEKEMARYGITRVPVDYFHYGPYRYSNLNDALSQAKKENG